MDAGLVEDRAGVAGRAAATAARRSSSSVVLGRVAPVEAHGGAVDLLQPIQGRRRRIGAEGAGEQVLDGDHPPCRTPARSPWPDWGANPPEDAVYPLNVADADGQPLDGDHAHRLHFDKDELPPVGAFWSVTMYDADGFQAANPLNRFALGDRDDLTYNDDGCLDLYLQHHSPGPDREAKWLPAPRGPLGVTMRLYAPASQVLDGRWNPPAITRVDQ